MDEMMFGRYFFRFSKSIWKGNFPARCVLVVFVRKCENSVFISPQKNKVEIELRFFVNLEGFLPVVREKVKNDSVATFYDVYDVFDPKFGPFSTFRPD